MSQVFVLDTQHRPLSPCRPARARWLLDQGKAAVWRSAPFTIILKCAGSDAQPQPQPQPQPLRLKIAPGSTTSGLAVVNDVTGHVVWAGDLAHRGQQIKERLDQRRACRRSRRQRHTRYRPARFANRKRLAGWVPPSQESRLSNMLTWVARLRRCAPIGAISQELVRFDTQLLQHPEIRGTEYQQGELAGYEVREYLLEKWGRSCAYCHKSGMPLQIEQIVPKSRNGSDRVSNLTLACQSGNQAKDNRTASEFGHPEVEAQAKRPLRDAAAVNASRWALFRRLQATGLPVETGTGGRTKWNRTRRGLAKAHWLDAACVGASTPEELYVAGIRPLAITAMGHGNRQMCGTDRFGFPFRHRTRAKRHFGFQTGELVRAAVPAGRKTAGQHVGRVLVRASGSFDVVAVPGRPSGISFRYCQVIARSDGYRYGN